jgi:hypothetical protein
MVTPLKRTLFEHRDFLSLLLAAPARIINNDNNNNDGVTAKYSQHGSRIVQRLVTYYQTNNNEEDDSSFTIVSTANELKLILSALAEECHTSTNAWVNDNYDEDELPTKKRARGVNRRPIHNNKNNNNLHSILKFVQRVIYQRYYHQKTQSNRRQFTTSNEDEYYLEHEMKLYFGSKDVLYQLDEDILSLAFNIAFDAIIHNRNVVHLMKNENTLESTTTTTTTTVGNDTIINAENNVIQKILQQNDQINDNNNNNDIIINTALQIIDYTVLASRCMRAKLDRIKQLQNRNTSSFITATSNNNTIAENNIINKRLKYHHLLNPIINQYDYNDDDDDADDDEEEDDNNEISYTGVTISVMEERYPQQWQWLYQFRLQLEEEEQKMANLLSSSSNNKSDTLPKTSVDGTNNFVIIRRKIEILDDISLSISDDNDSSSDEEPNQVRSLKSSATGAAVEGQPVIKPDQSEGEHIAASNKQSSALSSVLVTSTTSPFNNLDVETRQLRLVLLAMPPSESASSEVVRHTVNEIVNLLNRYVELDGTTGIKRCGDILSGRSVSHAINPTTIIDNDKDDDDDVDITPQRSSSIANMNRFPLTEAMTSLLVTTYLTDAMGALRAKTFLHSFLLPLILELNPSTRSIYSSGGLQPAVDHDVIKANNDLGKPASRVLTSLLTLLARERPMECVASIIIPSLVMTTTTKCTSLFEPNRFQCELISRVLRGKDALSSQAIAYLVSELLPTKEEVNALTTSSYSSSGLIGGMKWTENTIPLLTACLICHPTLSNDVVMTMSGMISYQLSSTNVTSSSTLMAAAKSIKFSTLFQTFVTKYGSQVKSIHKVESLLDSATRLKTFMSKTICLSLKKLL